MSSLVSRGVCFLQLACAMLIFPPQIYSHGDLHEAIEELSFQIKNNPTNHALRLKRGELELAHGNWQAALEDFDRAAQLSPDIAGYGFARAKALLHGGKLSLAKKGLAPFLARYPTHFEGLLLHARILAGLGQSLEAAKEIRKAIAADRAEPDVYVECARILMAAEGNHLPEALEVINDGIRKLGHIVTLELLAIELEIKLNRYEQALVRIESARKGSACPEMWLLRKGQTLERAGRIQEAGEAYLVALRSLEALPSARRSSPGTTMIEAHLNAALAKIGSKQPQNCE
jgi:tetratricopeptide (TPR) repeat protein